jgi:hypothetical protein
MIGHPSNAVAKTTLFSLVAMTRFSCYDRYGRPEAALASVGLGRLGKAPQLKALGLGQPALHW